MNYIENHRCISIYLKYIKVVSKIENWFLECKFNPKYKYCQNRLKREYEEIYTN